MAGREQINFAAKGAWIAAAASDTGGVGADRRKKLDARRLFFPSLLTLTDLS